MRIAIIGGCGFVGHHLGPKLRNDGHDVLLIDNLAVNSVASMAVESVTKVVSKEAPNPWLDRYMSIVRGRAALWVDAGCEFSLTDARDYHKLSHVLGQWNPDAIVHLAAVAHITVARADHDLAYRNSIDTLRNALDAAVACGVKRFVYFSSSTTYGNFKKPIVDENEPLDPDTMYGSLKVMGEVMVKAWSKLKGLPYTIVRPQALYGPRCVSRRVTQIFIENALDQKPLRIDGDGSAAHDFTYIDDLTAGVAAIFTHLDASRNETFCLTAGEARSLKNLAEIVQSHIPCEIVHGPPDPEKPSRGTMSPEKAKRLLEWEPKFNLDRGMELYCRYYKENFT